MGIVDTGAVVSIIRREVAQACGLRGIASPIRNVSGIEGRTMAIGHSYKIRLEIGGRKMQVGTFYELSQLPQDVDLILGMDWLRQHRAVIRCEDSCLLLPESYETREKTDRKGPETAPASSQVHMKVQ